MTVNKTTRQDAIDAVERVFSGEGTVEDANLLMAVANRIPRTGKAPKPIQDALDELDALLQRKDITPVEFAECAQAIMDMLS